MSIDQSETPILDDRADTYKNQIIMKRNVRTLAGYKRSKLDVGNEKVKRARNVICIPEMEDEEEGKLWVG